MPFYKTLAENQKKILRVANLLFAITLALIVTVMLVWHAGIASRITSIGLGKDGEKNFSEHLALAVSRVKEYFSKK